MVIVTSHSKKAKPMKHNILFFLFAALTLTGCRKQVSNYDRPDFDPQPTLNAVLQKDQPVWAQVTFAQGLDSVHPSACENAEVLLYVDGQFVESLQHQGNGFYVGETPAEALHEYACKVVIPGYDTLFAQTEMPEKPVVTHVEIMENATVNDEGHSCPSILVTFRNKPTQNLFFNANMDVVFKCNYESGYSMSDGTVTSSINTDDPVLLHEGSSRLLHSCLFVSAPCYFPGPSPAKYRRH